MYYRSVTELIGGTPLLELANFEKKNSLKCKILAKLEYLNPAGSIKDRIAKAMIEDAEARGLLKKGGTIIEPTSGNTGIGLASVAASKGYKLILTMPETMSEERRNLLKAYGAELVLTKGGLGMQGAVDKAEEIKREVGGIILGQFINPVNPQTHYLTTGREIWQDTDGIVDFFVACVGTGGTLSGTGRYLKEMNPDIKVVAVEPESSPLLSKGYAGTHEIQGIGANFIPDTLDRNIYDEIITAPNDKAFEYGKEIGKCEGVLIGISSGAALYAAAKIAKRPENANKTIAVIFPDTGDRYLSTRLFK